jgi:hypothetical protein
LPEKIDVLQPAALLMPVTVTIVIPIVSRPVPGTVNVPEVEAIVIDAVCAVALLTPERL